MKNLQTALALKQLYQLKSCGYKYTSIKLENTKNISLSLPGTLEGIHKQANSCHLCELSKSRTRVLFGSGNAEADIMFVGASPSASEDASGDLFVGRAGEMLDGMITKVLGIAKNSVYLTNIVKCYPPQSRNISEFEASTCFSYLESQIKLIKPRIVVALGDEPYKYLTNDDQDMSKVHGIAIKINDTIVVPTYHPSFLLKNPSYKKDALSDLIKIKSLLK